MRDLLFLAHRIPYPPDKGDKIRSWNFLRHLARRYRVHLGAFVDDPNDFEHLAELMAICADVHLAPLNPLVARIASLRGLAQGVPLSLPHYRDAGLMAWSRAVLARQPERVFVFSSPMAQYADGPVGSGTRRVIDFVDVDSEKWREYAERKSWPARLIYAREAKTLLAYERRIAAAFDASLFVSTAEADLFRRLAPEAAAKVTHVDNGVDTDYFSPERTYDNPFAAGGPALVFTGQMDYWPNVDAVAFFAREALPLIRAQQPDARFVIVGSRPAPEVRALEALPGVVVTGRVPDVRPYLAHANAAVVPLRIARGVQNKLLEAMAMGRPVVASRRALAGVGEAAGRHVLAADSAEETAAAALSLLRGPQARRLGPSARAFVVQRFTWATHVRRLEAILEGEDALIPA
jgi:sugar transferase (PEP-CTERM/EpsH1 system associated)